MKASDLFLKALEEEGVEHIFGIPGEENLDFLNTNDLKNIEFIYRKIDKFSWKFCNKGFFNFKNYIPKIIQEFI